MNLTLVGASYRTAPVAVREKLALAGDRLATALTDLLARFGGEAVVLGTCNRLEFYANDAADFTADAAAQILGEWQSLDPAAIRPHLYEQRGADAVKHLFRVAASLDSLVIGEGQIAGQVKQAYELAQKHAAAGPLLHALFQAARVVAKRVRRETGISRGHVSVSSVAVDYVRQVFEHFHDKTVLVIGAGKMGELTLRHLRDLKPQRIWVTNRTPARAEAVASGCGGTAVGWDDLDASLAKADIILSTTGAAEPIVTRQRFARAVAKRTGGPQVILDIAVPRDFDPDIHDGERVCLFNIDDLQRIREQTLAERAKAVAPAEAIAEQEAKRFTADWARRRNGPVIARLTADCDAKRAAVVARLLQKLDGKLTDADRQTVEGAFRLLQNQFLHGPLSALGEASREGGGASLLAALRQLFRIDEPA